MSGITINSERFFARLSKLQSHFEKNKADLYGNSDSLVIPLGSSTGDVAYSKAASLHLYLLGFEFPDSIIIIRKGTFHFMATAKKCQYLREFLVPNANENTSTIELIEKTKDDGQNRENMNELVNILRKDKGKKVGSIFKQSEGFQGKFIPGFMTMVKDSQLDMVEIANALSSFFMLKDQDELENCKRASILTNKVMKHGFVSEMETILDGDDKISHENLSGKVDSIIMDPSKIKVNISSDAVDSCYTPIIQSGGKYDIKVSAYSNTDNLTPDVIISSMGARYKGYCANMSRTFMVDAPSMVEKTYNSLLILYTHCLEQMIIGNSIKDVVINARKFVENKYPNLLSCLPKTLGWGIGLEFRDSAAVLNDKNDLKFEDGQVYALSVGFHNVPLTDEDKSSSPSSIKKLNTFSVLIGDTVKVVTSGPADVLTKFSREFSDVSYNINGDDDEGSEDGDDDDDAMDVDGQRRSKRNKAEKTAMMNAVASRRETQKELMKKNVEKARKKLEALEKGETVDDDEEEEWTDLNVYRSPAEYPRDTLSTQLRVDLDKESIIVPINGQPVPFHVSTIKNINMPDPDKATYLRINFYTSGSSIAKDTPKNMAGLLGKYGDRACYIKELTFRSISAKNLAQVHMQYQELRKRVKQRELKHEQEKDLVKQDKLIQIKDQRVPRLQDLTMRPTMTGRKCVGTLAAHQNGVRFTSVRSEILDILYDNVKHAIYQPCDVKTSMVVVHFHLKDYIMIGKKKQKDVTFYTEVVDTSVSLDASKRSSYDPDELDEEQREREMRRRMNLAFKDFCMKLEKVASHYDHSLQIDVPFTKSAFEGNAKSEMVRITPTTHCLVNLTETPVLCITINDIEHVHFERAGFTTKAFDMVLVFKNWNIAPKSIIGIETKYMDTIQEWLNLVEITYSTGAQPIDWTEVMNAVKADHRFWYDTEDDGTKKPAGWAFLDISDTTGDSDAGSDDDEESSFANSDESGSESESESGSDDESFAEDDDSEGSDDDESDEEQGEDWDELERKAKADDTAKRSYAGDEPAAVSKKARR
jgi:nucleosome binding factor SPN SPT16 subunit